MRVAVVAPGKLLLDEAGAIYLGSKGYDVVRLEVGWKRYPWATHGLTLAMADKADRARELAGMVKSYADFVEAT